MRSQSVIQLPPNGQDLASTQVEGMQKRKLTPNAIKETVVDIKTDQDTILARNWKKVKCSILHSKVQEQTDFFIFKSKLLVFKIQTKIKFRSEHMSFVVKRFESDFYCIRNILNLTYGQCFIPPLCPTAKETTFEKKSMDNRKRSFSRFIRSVLRSPELSSHPLLVEFLKEDHSRQEDKEGMKLFSKRLMKEEDDLKKITSYYGRQKMDNKIYRVASHKERLVVERLSLEDLVEANKILGIQRDQKIDEKAYVLRYEQQITGALGLMARF
jgi:hypothetical protein